MPAIPRRFPRKPAVDLVSGAGNPPILLKDDALRAQVCQTEPVNYRLHEKNRSPAVDQSPGSVSWSVCVLGEPTYQRRSGAIRGRERYRASACWNVAVRSLACSRPDEGLGLAAPF
jgi:hypothetical protein